MTAVKTDPNTSSTQDIPTYAPGLDEDDPSKKKKSPKQKYRKKGINPHLFFDIKAELVRKIPWNINGTQTLQVRCKEEEYIDTMERWEMVGSQKYFEEGAKWALQYRTMYWVTYVYEP